MPALNEEELAAAKAEEEAKIKAAEEAIDPLLELANWKFLVSLESTAADEKAELKTKIMERITKNSMAPFYLHLCGELGWMEDEALTKTMTEANEKALAAFDEKEKDAVENLGDTEVREVKMARAEFLASIGEKQKAMDAFNDANTKTVGMGTRIDVSFAKIRLGLFWRDRTMIQEEIETAKGQVEKGGDWERRNLLGVYESAELILNRDLSAAALKLLDSVATFTCYKLFNYNAFVFYTVVTAVITLDRVSLKDRVIKSPEILEVIDEIPHLRSFLFSLYQCKYAEFFRALTMMSKAIKSDQYMHQHVGYFMREARVVAYKQLLESYRSVTLSSMAETFGVSEEFLDKELSRFIAAGRLSCTIDKVGGIVETVRVDNKNKQYNDTIKHGDLLLNRIQKLTKFINY